MIFVFFSLIIFFGILFIFGWQTARFVLNERRIEVLIALALIFGIGIYLSFLVSLSYITDIQINFYLILALFAILSYFFYRINRKKERYEWGIDKRWRIILFTTCILIMLFTAIVGIRNISAAAGYFNHLPLAATIAEGNFPVKSLFAPHYSEQYHYGYNLFLAAISRVTGLPIWFSHDLHNAVFFGIMFLLGFLLTKSFCHDNFKSYFASLIMILGGNLNFLYLADGLSSLYQKYVLNLEVSAPFKFLNDMIFGKGDLRGGLVAIYSNAAWATLGFALAIAIIYLYFRAINDRGNWLKITFLNGILFSFLALSAEIFFAALALVFLIYPLIYRSSQILKTSFLILFLGSMIALLQGGIATNAVKQIFLGESLPIDYQLSIAPQHLLRGLIMADAGVFVPIFSMEVFLAWGWLIIFIIPVGVFILKRYFQTGLFLMLLAFISFFTPLISTAGFSQGDFMRINYLTALFWNLIFGLFLCHIFLSFKRKWQKLPIIILFLAVIFQGMSYFLLFAAFPSMEMGKSFLGNDFSEPDPAEIKAFDWAKKHTTIKDYFLTFGEETPVTHRNAKFIMYTGRFAPGFLYGAEEQLAIHPRYRNLKELGSQKALYQKVLEKCDPSALEALNYSYLYVNKHWPAGLEEKCLNSNVLEIELEVREGDEFARIFKVINY